ncbi:hypothetical protein K2173_000462 [Erythroxylum novogranatense]|uniref:WPP domain-associated protein n=1 Tax=Erythroxylum novogranatense TaxID=1862640 RepID=A0AAV8SWB7_9ROSI|nr:hypothetical protein K2173_000462 [Erythroxylum novogranatense]
MGSQEVLSSSEISDACVSSKDGGLAHLQDDLLEIENPEVDLIKELDSYWEDINKRLTVSRMVSDSVIKGVISAVEEEAAEKIAKHELELARLEESLHLYHVGADDSENIRFPVLTHKPISKQYGHCLSYSDTLPGHDRLQESLGNLKLAAKEQFRKLNIEIDKIKGTYSLRRNGSGSELGLSDILPEKVPDKWIGVNRMLDGLRITLDSIYKEADLIVHFSKSSLFDWQQEREFQTEIQGLVMKTYVRNLQDDFEQSLWNQNDLSYGNESAHWTKKIKEISKLREELDDISRSLFTSESGHLISHGSLEHHKVSGNHLSSASSHWEGNGKLDGLIIAPENLDISQLRHMSRDRLEDYFKAELIKMKRNHESKVQELTEELFSLKREYMREKGFSLPVKKDKDLDLLRKKIPEVIVKLDGILMENDERPSLIISKNRLESLLSENRHLKHLLNEKKKEIKCLSSQVSDAAEEKSRHSLAEANLLRTVVDLKSNIEDARVEASINDDLFKFVFKEHMDEIKFLSEESNMELGIVPGIYETMFREAAQTVELNSKLQIDDVDMESIIMQGLSEVISKGALKEAEKELANLKFKYTNENETRLSLEIQALEKEKTFRLIAAEKEKLEQEIITLNARVDESDRLVQEKVEALVKEKERYDSATQELQDLRSLLSQQKTLILQGNEEVEALKYNLSDALNKIRLHEGGISDLRERLELETKKLQEAAEEKSILVANAKEKQDSLAMAEAREMQYKKQMDSITGILHGLLGVFSKFECRVAEDIRRKSLRLATLTSELSSLSEKANKLRKTGLQYKQRFERRSSDLQKAEAEVDLLGDEVDTLLGLLEKIYIALDHYSPILKHYPGIIEILKLVRRELTGESIKSV